jgi:hypothetical protein
MPPWREPHRASIPPETSEGLGRLGRARFYRAGIDSGAASAHHGTQIFSLSERSSNIPNQESSWQDLRSLLKSLPIVSGRIEALSLSGDSAQRHLAKRDQDSIILRTTHHEWDWEFPVGDFGRSRGPS